jgi:hypothetical protein
LADGASENVNITNGYKGYAIYKISTSAGAWVRIYSDSASRTADSSRLETEDPLPDAGVILEVVTSGSETVLITPGVIGFNNESPVTNVIPLTVTNKSGSAAAVIITITAIKLEN